MSGKHGRVELNNIDSQHPNGHSAHMEMNFTSVQVWTQCTAVDRMVNVPGRKEAGILKFKFMF